MKTLNSRGQIFGQLTMVITLMGLVAMEPSDSSAQIPDEFTNLQVIDNAISKGELIGKMRGFASALGMRCNSCHVGDPSGSLDGMDFATDSLQNKRTARLMLRMTKAINNDHISKVEAGSNTGVKVQCVTCHRGQGHPRQIEDVLMSAHNQGGYEVLEHVYDSLRERYYGSHTFNFRFSVLTSLAEDLARSDNLDDALKVLKLNEIHNPDAAWNYALMGQLYMQKNDNESAAESFRRVLEIEPDNRRAKGMLERLAKPE